MKKIFMTISIVSTLGISSVLVGATPTQAEEPNQNYSQSTLESKISELQEEMYQAQLEFEELNNAISEVKKKMAEKKQHMENIKTSIKNLQKEIDEITKRMEVRNEILKERARSLQESGGGLSYLNVLFGSQSFSHFIERLEAVAIIVQADKNLLEAHKTDKEKIEKSQFKMKLELSSVGTMINDLKKMEDELNEKKKKQNNYIEELRKKEEAVQAEIFALKDAQKELLNKQDKKEISTRSITDNDNQLAVNGGFVWPTIGGVITSYQGMRWGAFHKGIDIAGPSDYSILAARGGTVTYAGWINGYGNTIKIKHDNGYITQYAHLASIKVKAGQKISQGNTIGIMGTTGRSTGIHLDFEVYQNGILLNPIDVLPSR